MNLRDTVLGLPLQCLRVAALGLMLNRLRKTQVEAVIEKVGEGRSLSTELIAQIRAKTDGVPLIVEELTKEYDARDEDAVLRHPKSSECPHHSTHENGKPNVRNRRRWGIS